MVPETSALILLLWQKLRFSYPTTLCDKPHARQGDV